MYRIQSRFIGYFLPYNLFRAMNCTADAIMQIEQIMWESRIQTGDPCGRPSSS
jgi:hypothetical protein